MLPAPRRDGSHLGSSSRPLPVHFQPSLTSPSRAPGCSGQLIQARHQTFTLQIPQDVFSTSSHFSRALETSHWAPYDRTGVGDAALLSRAVLAHCGLGHLKSAAKLGSRNRPLAKEHHKIHPRGDQCGAAPREPLALAPPPSWRQGQAPARDSGRASVSLRRMPCRETHPPSLATALLEALANRGFVNRKISVMGIQ